MTSAQATYTMDSDLALFSFLSSHQHLLNRLNDELGQRASHQKGRHTDALLHLNFHNTSVADRRLSTDLIQNKHFSFDLGGDSDHFPSLRRDSSKEGVNKDYSMRGDETKSYKKRDMCDFIDDNNNFKRKRRLSSLGFLSASFFEDHAKTARRESMASIATFSSMTSLQKPNRRELNDDFRKEAADEASIISGMGEDYDVMGSVAVDHIHVCAQPCLVASEIKALMESFSETMAMSQKSQQAIHDWDKKMGLKRSHSKTMRLSMRSRKKLNTMIKKGISTMVA